MAKTTTPQIKIFNVETGEEIIRDMNAEELAQHEADKAIAVSAEEAKAKAEADKATLLARLGLTAEEAALLLS